MSMNRYGVIARRHWARWLPRQYAAISNPVPRLTSPVLGEGCQRPAEPSISGALAC